MSNKLYVAWIEYDYPGDGVTFLQGMQRISKGKNYLICNLLSFMKPRNLFPWVKKSHRKPKWFHSRLLDKAHPWLPIYSKDGQIMIHPNEKKVVLVSPPSSVHPLGKFEIKLVDEPLYIMLRNEYGNDEFNRIIKEQTSFISKWVFSPGIKFDIGTTELTYEKDYDKSAKIIGIGGHGGNLGVWGGGERVELRESLLSWVLGGDENRPSPYYIIVATCNNLDEQHSSEWLPAFQQGNPIRGILGYQTAYPGSTPGRDIFTRFCVLLKKGNTVLKAWELSQDRSRTWRTWGAIIHQDALNDTIFSLKGDVKKLDPFPKKEIFFYKRSMIRGEHIKVIRSSIKDLPRRIEVRFKVDGEVVTPDNNKQLGLVPGKPVSIQVRLKDPHKKYFEKNDKVKLIFNLIRCSHENMDVNKLFNIAEAKRKSKNLSTNYRQRHRFHCNSPTMPDENCDDTIEYKCLSKCDEFIIDLTVHRDAIKHYVLQGERGVEPVHGHFWILAMMEQWFHSPIFGYFQYEDGSVPFKREGIYLFEK